MHSAWCNMLSRTLSGIPPCEPPPGRSLLRHFCTAGLNAGDRASASGILLPSGKLGKPCARMHTANATGELTDAAVRPGLPDDPQAASASAQAAAATAITYWLLTPSLYASAHNGSITPLHRCYPASVMRWHGGLMRTRCCNQSDSVECASVSTTGDDGPRVTISEADSETFSSAPELAQAFGSPVFEPTWWPADTEEISYCLVRSLGGVHYQIGATCGEGVPICVIGHFEAALAGRSPRDWLHGEWSEPPELAHVRGLIGRVGIPRRLQAVIYDQELQIQLIGYDTEHEIMTTVNSLRRTNFE
jgi:hypothetical protein